MKLQPTALLGLGTMGAGMAANLLKAGVPLTVYNRTPAKGQPLAAQGAKLASTPAEAAKNAAVVVSMLADDDASRAVWLGAEGALAAMQSGSYAVESGTVSPAWVAELQTAAGEHGVHLVEAPVTGSRAQAEAGQLTFLVGAADDDLAAVRPVLETMSKAIVHLGAPGTAAEMKLINNFLCGVQVASFAQALTWIERSGLDRAQALAFLQAGAPGSGILSAMAERMTTRTYEVNFALKLMGKDLRYAHKAAAEKAIDLSTAAASEQLFARAQQQGLGEQDMAAVVEVVRETQPESLSNSSPNTARS